MLYWVNMASYKAIRPLCPAAAQARASKTGIACKIPIIYGVVRTEGRWSEDLSHGVERQHSPSPSAGSAPSAGPAAHSETEGSHGASAACQRQRLRWSLASSLGLGSATPTPAMQEGHWQVTVLTVTFWLYSIVIISHTSYDLMAQYLVYPQGCSTCWRKRVLWLRDGVICKCRLGPFGLIVQINCCFCFSVWLICLLTEADCWHSLKLLFMFAFRSINICFVKLGTLALGAYTFMTAISCLLSPWSLYSDLSF